MQGEMVNKHLSLARKFAITIKDTFLALQVSTIIIL